MLEKAPAYLSFAIFACLGVLVGCEKDKAPDTPKAVPVQSESEPDEQPEESDRSTERDRPGAGLPPTQANQASDESEQKFSHRYAEDNPRWDAWCEENVDRIEKLKDGLPDTCEEDADCRSIYLGCPMGCKTYVAKSPKAKQFIEEKTEFLRHCSDCMYRCLPQGPPMCEDGECVSNPDAIPEQPEIEIIRGSDDY